MTMTVRTENNESETETLHQAVMTVRSNYYVFYRLTIYRVLNNNYIFY